MSQDFAEIERHHDAPPDEPYPARFTCPHCGSPEVLVVGSFLPLLRCGTCDHEWETDDA